MKSIKICLKKRNREGEFDQGTLHAGTEISQWNPFVQLIYANKRGRKLIMIRKSNKMSPECIKYCKKIFCTPIHLSDEKIQSNRLTTKSPIFKITYTR
jgi:ribosomal protein S2